MLDVYGRFPNLGLTCKGTPEVFISLKANFRESVGEEKGVWSQQDRYHLSYHWSSHRKHQDTGCLPGTQSQTSVAFVVVLVHWRSRAFFFSYCKVEISSVAQSCPTLCEPMDCSTPGLPVHYQLPELVHTYVLRVCDAIQPSHSPSSPSPPAINLF